jgi:hypothetical protein
MFVFRRFSLTGNFIRSKLYKSLNSVACFQWNANLTFPFLSNFSKIIWFHIFLSYKDWKDATYVVYKFYMYIECWITKAFNRQYKKEKVQSTIIRTEVKNHLVQYDIILPSIFCKNFFIRILFFNIYILIKLLLNDI